MHKYFLFLISPIPMKVFNAQGSLKNVQPGKILDWIGNRTQRLRLGHIPPSLLHWLGYLRLPAETSITLKWFTSLISSINTDDGHKLQPLTGRCVQLRLGFKSSSLDSTQIKIACDLEVCVPLFYFKLKLSSICHNRNVQVLTGSSQSSCNFQDLLFAKRGKQTIKHLRFLCVQSGRSS